MELRFLDTTGFCLDSLTTGVCFGILDGFSKSFTLKACLLLEWSMFDHVVMVLHCSLVSQLARLHGSKADV